MRKNNSIWGSFNTLGKSLLFSSSLFASWQLDAISLFPLDLQFALAHQTASAETEAELRSIVVGLQEESDLNKDLVLSLSTELEKSQQKIVELEEQIRWQQLENQNQLNVKEAKINALKKALNLDGMERRQRVLFNSIDN